MKLLNFPNVSHPITATLDYEQSLFCWKINAVTGGEERMEK